jgi:hypothetical protein
MQEPISEEGVSQDVRRGSSDPANNNNESVTNGLPSEKIEDVSEQSIEHQEDMVDEKGHKALSTVTPSTPIGSPSEGRDFHPITLPNAPTLERPQYYESLASFELFGNGLTLGTRRMKGCIRDDSPSEVVITLRLNLHIFFNGLEITRARAEKGKQNSHEVLAYSGIDLYFFKIVTQTRYQHAADALNLSAGIETQFLGVSCGYTIEKERRKIGLLREHVFKRVGQFSLKWDILQIGIESRHSFRSHGDGAIDKQYGRDATFQVSESGVTSYPLPIPFLAVPTRSSHIDAPATQDPEHQPVVEQASPVSDDNNYHENTHFIVIGIFSRDTEVPRERLLRVSNPKVFFKELAWSIIKLRGKEALFSLKDVKGFGVYQVEFLILWTTSNDTDNVSVHPISPLPHTHQATWTRSSQSTMACLQRPRLF